MITNPIGHPKLAILAGLLMGALTITVFMLRPGKGGVPADPAGFEHRDASSAGTPDSPQAASLATGKVSVPAGNRSDASHVAVLDAVRASLQRNDLASAKVLLGAEQTLYQDDPRVAALRRELQAREEAVDHAMSGGEHSPGAPATPRSNQLASRFSSRSEHGRSGAALIHERVDRASRYAQSRRLPEVETAVDTNVNPEQSNPVPANPEVAVALPVPALVQPVAEAPPFVQSVAPPPPVIAAVQMTQYEPTRSAAPAVSTQAPKTRAEVRMEVERARADGDLPRFGNPDPAGPGGAPSRTSHTVVLDW